MAHRTPLSDREEDTWLSLYTLLQCLPGLLDQQLRSDADLGHYDYAVLHALHGNPGRTATMADLTRATSGSYSRLSHTVARLEERGFVTRARQGANRQVSLTRDGRHAFLSAAAGHMDEIRHHVLDRLPPGGVDLLGDLLRPIADHLRADLRRG